MDRPRNSLLTDSNLVPSSSNPPPQADPNTDVRRDGRTSLDFVHGAPTGDVNVDEQLLEALARAASDDCVEPDVLVEEALRRYFGVRGIAVLDDIASAQKVAGVQASDEDAMALAVAELRACA
jgi:hypothetical protein